jgi:hypothetical protein
MSYNLLVKVICWSNDQINSITSLNLLIYKIKATHSNCGNVLRAFSTTLFHESAINTRGNDLEHSKNEKDWIIRSQVPNSG